MDDQLKITNPAPLVLPEEGATETAVVKQRPVRLVNVDVGPAPQRWISTKIDQHDHFKPNNKINMYIPYLWDAQIPDVVSTKWS
jgi:hypothetical protein